MPQRALWLLLLLFSFGCGSTQEQTTPPNVIFILADDLGAGDLGCTGHPYVKSPNIDRLAAEGIRFTQGYMAASWCSPSRYALMTGQYPAKRFYSNLNMLPSETTVTQLLKRNGYRTAHFGKWHLNRGTDHAHALSEFGIDEQFHHNGSQESWSKEEKNSPHWRERTTDFYVDKTIDFIERQDGQPFYVNLWLYPTHSYINPTPEQLAAYEPFEVDPEAFDNPLQREFLAFVSEHGDIHEAMRAYCADVTSMDQAIGRLMDFLKAKGLDENTLIAFSSDNGPGPLTQQVERKSVVSRYEERPTLLNSVGSAGDYRERKLSVLEGGIRVPFIVRWPASGVEGRVDRTTVIGGTDWLPTIAAVCGLQLEDPNVDGLDRSQSFLGKPVVREEPYFWRDNKQGAAIRLGDYKGVKRRGTFSLFDLAHDVSESQDLTDSQPDKALEMEARLDEWLATLPTVE